MTPSDLPGTGHVLAEELRRAAAEGDLVPWYQPVVRISDGALLGFEALARWHRSAGPPEAPSRFVDEAERLGVVDVVDLAVASNAAADLARWRVRRPGLRLGVNCGAWVLDEADGPARVVEALAPLGGELTGVSVELTERLRPRDPSRVAEVVAGLRAAGLEVWFDDFGTGWAELVHAVEVPVDGIKLDRYFTERLDGSGAVVVRALLDVAAGLGLRTVLEGVATAAQAERAAELGCETGQGFWWSEPLPPDEAARLVASDDPVLPG